MKTETNKNHGFFAYPSTPPYIGETIRNAIAKINTTGAVTLQSWESCRVGGKVMISEICNAIDSAALFCADLTYLNHNVMFELGYAIARGKRIWLVIDPSVVETKAYLAKLKILTTVGYREYCNSDDIQSKFLNEQPWADLSATVFSACILPHLPSTIHETVFYLKSRHNTEASTVISTEVASAAHALGIPEIVDDPWETTIQPLEWYGEQAYNALCVVVHLENPAREGANLHNAKYSFVAGLVRGLDKKVLILAHADYVAPLDYHDLLKHYLTATEAERYLHNWLRPILDVQKTAMAKKDKFLSTIKLEQHLAQLRIGEPIAENEADQLVAEYFIETAAYKDALNGRQAIFVGRKGAGKTATFLKLSATLNSDKRNLVCVIKPPSYEFHGIVELLRRYRAFNLKGFALESIWKFLIYSEIALTIEASINSRPAGDIHVEEKDLIAVLNRHSEMLRQDFSVRLERCVQALTHAAKEVPDDSIEQHRTSISETLHAGILKSLVSAIIAASTGKMRIAILVDNLDKAWDKYSEISDLSEFLLALLSATSRITQDFRSIGAERRSLNVSLCVFLRTDIFQHVIKIAREPDKIVYTRLTWADPELLLRVIDERFFAALGTSPVEVWQKYFCSSIDGVPTREYLLKRILPRPRDLLFFVKASITNAVNRRHATVEERDIRDAEMQYSQFAIDSILVENAVNLQILENILYGFVGCEANLTRTEVENIVRREASDESTIPAIIEHLCNLTFLGVEVKPSEFRFAEDESEHKKIATLAQRLTVEQKRPFRYRVNPAFWAFLEIQKSQSDS